jgi:CBS domain-containing protein
MLTIADVMTRDVIWVAPDTSVQEVAKLLFERHISGAPVVNADGALVGIVSEGDLIRHAGAVGDSGPRSWWLRFFSDTAQGAAEYVKTHGRTAADVMTRQPITIPPDARLADVARLLEKHRIKRVPVVEGGRLVGIVTRSNLLQGLATATGPGTVSADDREIAKTLEAALGEQNFGIFINPIVQDGVVHLWGLVDNAAERRALVLLAEEVPGVKSVEDHLGQRPLARS